MAEFFIDTESGQVTTRKLMLARGELAADAQPVRPWFRIRASGDASTLWYAVLRKRTRGIFIGQLVLRHSTHHASRLESGWEDVPIASIGTPSPQPLGLRPQAWTTGIGQPPAPMPAEPAGEDVS